MNPDGNHFRVLLIQVREREDVERGLEVSSSRAEALGRFMASYAKLARLPKPELGTVQVDPLVASLDRTLADTRHLIGRFDEATGGDYTLMLQLRDLLEEMSQAARAVQSFSYYLLTVGAT